MSVDADDVVATDQARLGGRALWKHVDEEHASARFGLHLDSQADELTVDVVVQIAQPVGCQAVAVVIECVTATEDVLHHDRRAVQSELAFSESGDVRDDLMRGVTAVERLVPILRAERVAELRDVVLQRRTAAGEMMFEEFLVGQRDVEALGSMSHERRRTERIDEVRLDLVDDLVKEAQRIVSRQRQHVRAEAAVGVATFDAEVDLRATQAVAQLAIVGPLLDRGLVVLDRVDPTASPFKVLASLQRLPSVRDFGL